MYCDEYGNMWASYEDYQSYLKVAENETNHTERIITDMFKEMFDGIYIDSKGQMWESEQTYIEHCSQNEN